MQKSNKIAYSGISAGTLAMNALKMRRPGKVFAVFEHSFYIEVNKHWVCIGGNNLPMGPLNLCTDAPSGISWNASGIRRNQEVFIDKKNLSIGNHSLININQTTIWSPSKISGWNINSLEKGLAKFLDFDSFLYPNEGLAQLVFPNCTEKDTHRLKCAIEAIETLSKIVKNQDFAQSECNAAARGLLGLGPGLTPSGDDFLGGAMIALKILGEIAIMETIWKFLKNETLKLTNPISHAHLTAAHIGLGSKILHDLLTFIFLGKTQQIAATIPHIDKIGHTSGWDSLAGAFTVLTAWKDRKNFIYGPKAAPSQRGSEAP